MKKIILIALAGVLVFSTAAMAKGKGPGKGWNRPCVTADGVACPCNAAGDNFSGLQATQISEADARTTLQTHINANLKGYTITGAETIQTPRNSTAYKFSVQDAGGNSFIFIVGPYGHVKGPILPGAIGQRPLW